MAAAKPTNTLTAPSTMTSVPVGTDVAFFEPGISAYERLRLNGDVEIKLANGDVRKGTVRAMQVGPLIDLIVTYGSRHALSYGQTYSANGLVQSMTEAAGGEVVDVTKLYTVVMVQVQMEPSQMPGYIPPTA